ncbi:hypothetical protein TNCT_405841 [Trichonephila clavata]|uniref:Uncharacterized protein n=1 Tax=Trichonephila clavata TaxID=2740835 RepID=A0A8X6HC70_TRICU|nr:hypothetical protein TNCT_405841 [Trichonephila clavata]
MFHMGHLNSIIGAILRTHRTLWEFPASRQLYFYYFLHFLYLNTSTSDTCWIRDGVHLTQKIALVRARTQTSVSSFGMQVAIYNVVLQLKRKLHFLRGSLFYY